MCEAAERRKYGRADVPASPFPHCPVCGNEAQYPRSQRNSAIYEAFISLLRLRSHLANNDSTCRQCAQCGRVVMIDNNGNIDNTYADPFLDHTSWQRCSALLANASSFGGSLNEYVGHRLRHINSFESEEALIDFELKAAIKSLHEMTQRSQSNAATSSTKVEHTRMRLQFLLQEKAKCLLLANNKQQQIDNKQ